MNPLVTPAFQGGGFGSRRHGCVGLYRLGSSSVHEFTGPEAVKWNSPGARTLLRGVVPAFCDPLVWELKGYTTKNRRE